MKRKILIISTFLFYNLALFSQKNTFQKATVEVKRNQKNIEIKGYKGQPKELKFANTVYFNPLEFPKSFLIEETVFGSKINAPFYNHLSNQDSIINTQFQPFYFKKFEVTNAEYREFINWVMDSVCHSYMGNFVDPYEGPEFIDWETELDYESEDLDEVFLKDENGKNIGFDNRFLYFDYEETDSFYHIFVPTDTTCWQDIPTVTSIGNYHSHQAYNDFPVVGITYHQAKAYCVWLEMRLKEQLYFEGINDYEISVNLPTAAQWQQVAMFQDGKINLRIQDFSWQTDLYLTNNQKTKTIQSIRGNSFNFPFYSLDEENTTHFANLSNKQFKKTRKALQKQRKSSSIFNNLDRNNISGMGGNVSEWMRENYIDNWKTPINNHLKSLHSDTTFAEITFDLIHYYHENISKSTAANTKSQLVFGANWFDERYVIIDDKNVAGIFAKNFVPRNEAYATLGFRYVIEVKLKESSK